MRYTYRILAIVVLTILTAALGVVWLAHPVCVSLSEDDLRRFTPLPIQQRTDRDLFGFHTFQQQRGQWCQCKSWLSRQFFF